MRRLTLTVTATLACLALPAHAYSLQSGLTTTCHERITLTAFLTATATLEPGVAIPLPTSEAWRTLAQRIKERLPDSIALKDDPVFQLLMLSTLLGVRSPDTEGHSVSNLNSLRRIHADPSDEGQYAHALRGIGDDGPEGDAAAVEGTRRVIQGLIVQARDHALRPPAEQIIVVPVSLDFYGIVDVEVWAPAYYLGRAMHAMQDSFSHTLRSPDFAQVVSVFNYVEAISGELKEGRDGLAHSDKMDSCGSDTAPLVAQAEVASAALLEAAVAAFIAQDDAPIVAMLDEWLTYAGGCTLENGYCDSDWLSVARKDATGPYLGPLACSARPGAPAGWAGLLMCAVLLGLRRRWLIALVCLAPATSAAQANVQVDAHVSLLSDAPGRSILASTHGFSARGGWRWGRWGAYGLFERNFWIATEQTGGTHGGVANAGIGGEALFAEGRVRASFVAGVSVLREATALHDRGQVGGFTILRPLGIRWQTAPHVYVLLDPITAAVVSPVLEKPRILMLQYRTHVAVEYAF